MNGVQKHNGGERYSRLAEYCVVKGVSVQGELVRMRVLCVVIIIGISGEGEGRKTKILHNKLLTK